MSSHQPLHGGPCIVYLSSEGGRGREGGKGRDREGEEREGPATVALMFAVTN